MKKKSLKTWILLIIIQMSDIIKFEDFKKKKKVLSDDDIKSLFLGLINLVKSSAIEDITNKAIEESKKNTLLLNSAKIEIKLKDDELNKLKKENKELKSKAENLILKLEELKKEDKKIDKE